MHGNPLPRWGLQGFDWPAVLLALSACFGVDSKSRADDRVELGRLLFEHNWIENDPLSPYGDGVGPVHNADSCVACHNLGGSGGAGAAEHNVDLLTLAPGKREASTSQKLTALQTRAGRVHPAFSPGRNAVATIVLHHFGTDPEYERWRLGILGFKLPQDLRSERAAAVRRDAAEKLAGEPPVANLPRKAGVSFQLSHRNTPSLFGSGLIDSIADETLLDMAKTQAERSRDTAGRVARTADGSIGRFGWRGRVGTLREFVLSACAMELGLENPAHRQARSPLDPKALTLEGDDLTTAQCDSLVAYVASLPAPLKLKPDSRQQAERVGRGEKLFESCGCLACHVRDVGEVRGIYGDLLLHDLGSALADPVPALSEQEKGTELQPSGGSAYGGGRVESLADVSPQHREWKTPPLWGVRDSAPYLHDGRARTLVEAIRAHGGQAEASANKFRGLDYLSRSYVLDFLNSLGQPAEEPADVAGS
jgi:CxxC motif-containing protein (DUF1111 family)